MSNELISVIVPIYKVEPYLDKCISSIVNQTYQNLEIILVNDGSPDKCAEMCDAWAEKDGRIKVIHKQNGGLSDARNAGMCIAQGEYICFVDSDDWVEKDYVFFLKEAMTDNIDIVECATRLCNENNETLFVRGSSKKILNEEEALLALIEEREVFQTVWNKMYRRNLIKDIPFVVGKYHEDDFWTWKVFMKINSMCVISEPLYNYLQRKSGIMGTSYSLKRLDTLEARYERMVALRKFPELYKRAQINFIDSCMFSMQKSIKFLSTVELNKAKKVIRKYLNDIDVNNNNLLQVDSGGNIWRILFMEHPLLISCVRNILKVGY